MHTHRCLWKPELPMWLCGQFFKSTSSLVTVLSPKSNLLLLFVSYICALPYSLPHSYCFKITNRPQKNPPFRRYSSKKGMIQEIFSISFISRSFIGIQVNNHHTLYQYVTERHPKSKISSFPKESILSMWLSLNNTIFTEGWWMEDYRWTRFITYLLQVAASTASTDLLPLLLLLKHSPSFPLAVPVILNSPLSSLSSQYFCAPISFLLHCAWCSVK